MRRDWRLIWYYEDAEAGHFYYKKYLYLVLRDKRTVWFKGVDDYWNKPCRHLEERSLGASLKIFPVPWKKMVFEFIFVIIFVHIVEILEKYVFWHPNVHVCLCVKMCTKLWVTQYDPFSLNKSVRFFNSLFQSKFIPENPIWKRQIALIRLILYFLSKVFLKVKWLNQLF